ncbi:FixH family protein [Microvirga aerophila]|uniref:Nitrogen fixation protein FixH n=1 Tax=Microvirga aerophila TaxID=670291 RepID=A0A512BU43_9HYPH|nr:FixH family protein [Microvirga aerophila]GEO15452.1 nitrogen fixation protein FixH [Microvirga aerophila]
MPATASGTAASGRPLTGRMVLFCLLAFFGTILAMNVVLVRVALSSFGGVETDSSYKAGLAFKNDIAASQAQDARHWAVEASLRHESGGTRVTVSTHDAEAHPLAGLSIEARLAHPTDKRRDVTIDLAETESGRFEGLADAPRGQWDLVIGLKRRDEQVFRSKSRITL